MASDLALLSTFSNATREAHRAKVNYSGNKDRWLFNHIKTDPQKHAGESLVNFTLQYSLPESATYTSENAAHPTVVNPSFAKGQLYIKKLLAKMQYSEEIAHLTGNEAIVRRLLNLREGTYDTYMLLKDHSIYNAGNGILATCTADDDAAGGLTVDSVRWLRVGMRIDTYTTGASGTITGNSLVITDINPTTLKVTVSGTSTSVANTNVIYLEDTFTADVTISTTKFTNGIRPFVLTPTPIMGILRGLTATLITTPRRRLSMVRLPVPPRRSPWIACMI
jgi:hypothetical protein